MKADGRALDQADVFRSLPDRGFEAGEAGRAGLTTGDLVVAVGPEGGPDGRFSLLSRPRRTGEEARQWTGMYPDWRATELRATACEALPVPSKSMDARVPRRAQSKTRCAGNRNGTDGGHDPGHLEGLNGRLR